MSPKGDVIATTDLILKRRKIKSMGVDHVKGLVRIWDTQSGVVLAKIKGLPGASFQKDGSLVWAKWTMKKSGTYLKKRIFGQDNNAPGSRAISSVPRCLSPSQRDQFLMQPTPPTWCYKIKKWPYQ